MAMLRTLISLAAITMVVGSAMAANHTVGGPSGGWDQSTDLKSWASSQTFTVGDNLIFTYSPMHDVNEVSKADYDSCQSTNPMSTNTGGNTVVPLTTPGNRYFICGTIGHCSMGMKLQVNVLATAAPPAASITPSSAPPPSKSSVPSSAPSAPTPSATAPVASPVNSPAPEIAPAASLPSKPTAESPALSPDDDPSTGAASPPALDFPGTISPAGGVRESLPPPPSSANKVNVVAASAAAFAVIFIMLVL